MDRTREADDSASELEETSLLETRLGRVHARQRLAMEAGHERKIFDRGINFHHPENWYAIPSLVTAGLKLTGLYWRGRRNAERVRLVHNAIELAGLPELFDGFTILHISDLHADMNLGAMRRVAELARGARYDICVMTGDYRGNGAGPFDRAMEEVERVRGAIDAPVYGLLGNHDSIRMIPWLERMGIRMLVNESLAIVRGPDRIHMAGIDDAHFYRADNIEKAASQIPAGEFSILLSHTPEVFRQAAYADFRLMLCGHTHGGQLCLPGSIPLTLDAAQLPRRLGYGAWRYEGMAGYTSAGAGSSIVAVRFNRPPEITLHRLCRAPAPDEPAASA